MAWFLAGLLRPFHRVLHAVADWFVEPLELRLRHLPALPPLRFRRFAPEDAARCLELYRLNEPGRFPADVRAVYEHVIAHPSDGIFVVELDGEVVATCEVNLYTSRYQACLSYGLVHPDFHCRGIGTAMLLTRLVLAARMSGGCNQQIQMVAVDASAPFYRKMGFWGLSLTRDHEGIGEHTMMLLLTPRLAKRCAEVLAEAGISVPDGDIPHKTYDQLIKAVQLRAGPHSVDLQPDKAPSA